MEAVTLRTARLELSPPTAADVDAIVAACQDPGIVRYTPVPSPYHRSDAEQFVAKVAADWISNEHVTWAVRLDGAVAGMMGVYRLGTGSGELGYWTGPAFRGRGVVAEASRAVVDWAFALDGLALARLEWRAVVGNVASARAARAQGFRYEGLLRQALTSPRGRDDAWIAGLLSGDDRTPQPWPVLGD
ncbi:GNAT family N-acetyltransferase [Microbacterium sp. CJ88]|uniref:GNAT family N-acetyltransferase n=1 Tax=Microbacterium sp. CJ88 TaxID=3445672 RepID=UPI003F6561EA